MEIHFHSCLVYLGFESLDSYYSIGTSFHFSTHLFTLPFYEIASQSLNFFLLAMMTAILLGNYTKSPLSFFYSFLFWGTIICFRDRKKQIIFFLFISLCLSNALIGQGNFDIFTHY